MTGTGFARVNIAPLQPAPAHQPRPSRFGLPPTARPWLLVCLVYVGLYASLLVYSHSYPYVLDNNESYSSLWHARSLYENGVARTKGLTDEVFSPAPAASPYIHSHQGNFPRLFTFVFYALGLHGIGPQIWVATFTVGLATLWLAFRFFTRLAHPAFAALTCLLLMTDYLFFTQWQVGLYNIWHGFFFFSSLACIQALGETARRGRWFLLAALNFAALFYWEYVFTAFVVALCGLYTLVCHWRRPRLVALAAGAVAVGAGVAAGTLLLQLTAYMGWANVLEDVRLTLTARNAAADPALLERVTSFYREQHIIFWHNFLDATPLRTPRALWDSLFEFHLKYYSPVLLYSAVVLGAGWLLGCWQWAQRSWRRLLPLLALAGLAVWLWPWIREAQDPLLRAEYALTSGGATLLAAERGLLALVILVALACATAGNAAVLGHATGRVAGLLPLLLCGAAAYGLTYRAFTGYIYSGYLHRFVPLPVFLTVPLLGLALSLLFQAGRQAWMLARTPAAPPAARLWRGLPLVVVLATFAGFATYWVMLQVTYARVVPPDSYAFLRQLERPPFKGRSVVSNTYPAPMAGRTGSWGYADSTLLGGRVTLTADGFVPERDPKYLWFADRDTNPAYRKPELGITVVQRPNFSTALQFRREKAAAPAGRIPLAETTGLALRTRPLQQAFLHHRLAYSDGEYASVVVLDWDFPPFLRSDLDRFLPSASALSLREKLALSETTQDLRRRWRVVLTPRSTPSAPGRAVEIRAATIDGRPVFSAADYAAAGWAPAPDAPGARWQPPGTSSRSLATETEGLALQLTFASGPDAGQVQVEANDRVDTVDLHAAEAGERSFTLTAGVPHGRYTYVPALAPGLCVQTILPGPSGDRVAELRYHYAQQEGVPEAASIVRLYHENPAGRWQLADTITFLGAAGVPVRLDEFRTANPDTVREHDRIVAAGDRRSFEQWLADHLTLHPGEASRPGIVPAALPALATARGDAPWVSRRLPLPSGPGRWQFTVAPGTRTKTGPEYFGLPFTLPAAGGPVDFRPPPVAADAPLAFGRMKIRLRFPANRWPQSEPLVTTGGREAGDFIYVQYIDPQHIRIGFDHWFRGGPLSPPIAVDFTQEHELEISLGSFFPAREDVVFAGVSAAGVASVKDRVLVRLDGQPVIDAAGECYETGPGGVTVGRNTIFGTLCGPEFTGEILSLERIWPELAVPARDPDSP